jgi:hypothetical protein
MVTIHYLNFFLLRRRGYRLVGILLEFYLLTGINEALINCSSKPRHSYLRSPLLVIVKLFNTSTMVKYVPNLINHILINANIQETSRKGHKRKWN